MTLSNRLPKELIPDSSSSKVVGIMLGTAVVLAALNFAAWWLVETLPLSHDVHMTREKWQVLRGAGPGIDCLIVGDSSGNFGVAPEVLEAELGWTTRNICTTGRFLSIGNVWMLKEYIALHGVPEHVISVPAVRRWE